MMNVQFGSLRMQRFFRTGGKAVLGLALCLCLSAGAQASVIDIVDGEGFESPSYALA